MTKTMDSFVTRSPNNHWQDIGTAVALTNDMPGYIIQLFIVFVSHQATQCQTIQRRRALKPPQMEQMS